MFMRRMPTRWAWVSAVLAVCVVGWAVTVQGDVEVSDPPGPMRVAQFDSQMPEYLPPGAAAPPAAAGAFEGPFFSGADAYCEPWEWHVLPDGLIYRSYLAGQREPRLAALFAYERKSARWLLDGTLGGRVSLFRYGTLGGVRPEGWEFDVEGAAFPRLDLDEEFDLQATDYRAGAMITHGVDRWQTKFAYYHLSSHLGDEFMVKNPTIERINYVRDALVLGLGYFLVDSVRLYGEAGWAFNTDGGAKPWEFQFGAEFSPAYAFGARGAPFAAVNGHLREENNFGGNVSAQIGWQWLSETTGSRLRTGFQYLNGKSPQTQFFNQFEEQIDIGLWYDY